MGRSASAHLVYGIRIPADQWESWREKMDEEFMSGIESWGVHDLVAVKGGAEYPKGDYSSVLFREYLDKSELLNEKLVDDCTEKTYGCADSYEDEKDHFLIRESSVIDAHDYGSTRIGPHALTVSNYSDLALKKFAEFLGFDLDEIGGPGWYLCAYYG